MRTRIKSYDSLFDAMPAMGALMEQSGCEWAIPEYCFTSYPEPGYKDEESLWLTEIQIPVRRAADSPSRQTERS